MTWTLPTGARTVDANGTTHVTAVGAPSGSAKRMVTTARFRNLDSVEHIMAWVLNKGGVRTDLKRQAGVLPGGELVLETPVDLVATDESLEIVLGEAHTSVAPKAIYAFAEVSS